MSIKGRDLQPGDYAMTDYDRGWQKVRIMQRFEDQVSQSRICFTVHPPLRLMKATDLIDADWFEPAIEDGLPVTNQEAK